MSKRISLYTDLGATDFHNQPLYRVGTVSITNPVVSISSSTGSLLINGGGIGINSNLNATSISNGGSFTTAGGMAVKQSLYVGGYVGILDSNATAQAPIDIRTGAWVANLNAPGLRLSIANAPGGQPQNYPYCDFRLKSDQNGIFRGSLGMKGDELLSVISQGVNSCVNIYNPHGVTGSSSFALNANSDHYSASVMRFRNLATTGNINQTLSLENGTGLAGTSSLNLFYTSQTNQSNRGYLGLIANGSTGCVIKSYAEGTATPTSLILESNSYANQLVLNIDGTISESSTALASSPTAAAHVFAGGLGVNGNVIVNNSMMVGSALFQNRSISTITSSNGFAFIAGNVVDSICYRSNAGSGITDTFPTASDIASTIVYCQIGTSFKFIYYNSSAFSITIAPGTGGTLKTSSSTIAASNGIGVFLFVVTNTTSGTESYDVFRIA